MQVHLSATARFTEFRFPISLMTALLLVVAMATPVRAQLIPVDGYVIDAFTGNPVEHVQIEFVGDLGGSASASIEPDGYFVVELDDSQTYEINVVDMIGLDRYQPYSGEWMGQPSIEIQLDPRFAEVSLNLVSTGNPPPADPWQIILNQLPWSDQWLPSPFTVSFDMAPGTSETIGVPVGRYLVYIQRYDVATGSSAYLSGDVLIENDGPFNINIYDIQVTGTVASTTGAPIGGAALHGYFNVFSEVGPFAEQLDGQLTVGPVTTAADGSFAFNAIAGGGRLDIVAPGFNGASWDVPLNPGDAPSIDLGTITLEVLGETATGTGTASTDTDGEPGASATDPLETSVTSPNGMSDISITESPTTGTPPSGYGFVGQQIDITAEPGGTSADPLEIVFTIDASQVPPGEDHTTLQVTRNGLIVADCTQTAPTIDPDPCVSDRSVLGDDDVQLTVLTSAASRWNIVAATSTSIVAPVDGHLAQVGDAVTIVASTDGSGCTVDFGDGSSAQLESGVCSTTHTYSEAGVYTAAVTADGSADSVMIVVYDPDGGFVTGGGWIDSPPDAYALGATAGKASFGFVSRYKRGAAIPDGETEFVFSAAGFRFDSSAYEWLVVAGHSAQFKGWGAVNGVEGYRFMLWAGDGPDEFRIKVWTERDDGTDSVVYDNGPGQGIGGGSIVIHGG